MLSESLKLIWRVFFKRRPFPALLISSGITLLIAGYAQQWLANWDILIPLLNDYLSPETTKLIITLCDFFFSKDSSPQIIIIIFGGITFSLGVITGLINFYFEKKAILKSTVLPIELYGFSRAIPTTELYKELEGEGYNTSIRYKLNLSSYLDKPFVLRCDVNESIEIINRLFNSINLHRSDNDQLNINFTSIAQVPAVFQIGYSLGMMTRINIWSWDRFNQRWDNGGITFNMIRTLEINTGNTIICPQVVYDEHNNSQACDDEVGFSFSFTNRVNWELSIRDSAVSKLYDLYFDSKNNMNPNNLLSKSRRTEVLKKFNQIYEEKVKNKGYKKVHLFISAPTSFVFELGQMLSQNHFLPVIVYQYGDIRTVGKPYHSYSLEFSGTNPIAIKNIMEKNNEAFTAI